ncbi:hypothetical protein GUJ93_ZPchr0015g6689 [Zizania palustris]|uniref:SANTA domain-containing protein n=1 Tax=Zizania palustris TaxID=103762 RepID=A0A8J5W637_ZIZPA|nr:hypothetical protein GUJ93_ZPchr0015g6689 [Zizania palustris]
MPARKKPRNWPSASASASASADLHPASSGAGVPSATSSRRMPNSRFVPVVGGTPAGAPSPAVSCLQACVGLSEWWLERVEGEEGKVRVAGFDTRSRAGRKFTSASIKTRHVNGALETADGFIILVTCPSNVSKMHENGFPHEVSKYFRLGFPVQWEKYINSNKTVMNEQSQSPLKSTEYYIGKFLRGTLINSMGYTFAGDDLNTSQISTSNVDRFSSQRMDTPEEPLAAPGEPCDSDHANNQHECMHINTCEQGNNVQHGTSSAKPSAIPAEMYVRSQEEQDADIQQENVPMISSEQQIAARSNDPALINNHTNHATYDLEECGTPKRHKILVHQGTETASEIKTQGITPQDGVTRGSEVNTVRILRNGKMFGMYTSSEKRVNKRDRMQNKSFNGDIMPNEYAVFGMSNDASLKKRVNERDKMQNKSFNGNIMPNEDVTCPADLISHENVGSVAVASSSKLQSHNLCPRGRKCNSKYGKRLRS